MSLARVVAGTGPDPTSISPGLIGFLATFALVAACILLFLSLVRRLRRLNYREAQAVAERRAADAAARDALADDVGPGVDDDEAPQAPVSTSKTAPDADPGPPPGAPAPPTRQ